MVPELGRDARVTLAQVGLALHVGADDRPLALALAGAGGKLFAEAGHHAGQEAAALAVRPDAGGALVGAPEPWTVADEESRT